ncbi:MAG: hypothetical protein IJ605_01105 [Prevotella sp.]|nr:hypothetical protein [Prevotella sp.]
MTDGYFNLADLEAELSRSRRFLDSFDVEMLFKVDSLKQLTRRLPRQGEIFFIETTKSFTAFTFIVHVLKAVGHIHHLYIATYSTNERIINALLRYRDRGQLESIHLHISETLRFRMPDIYQRLLDLRDKGILQLTFAWTHKKVTCMDTPQGAFVVEGSGNYGENALQEQYIFIQSEKVYEFRSGQVPRAKPQ